MGLSLATANSSYGYEKFTYNGFNQLTAFEDEAGNKATYEYYSDGLRLSKTVNGAKSSYILTDNNLSMEIKSDEVISYAKAPGYMRTGSSKDSLYRNDKLYLFNGHGDVTSTVDKNGKVTKTYSYDAFGNEVNRDKNDTNPFRYCGEYWDNETESIYLRARYYNPSIGRFTTEDPIKDESNWYAYCEGNPIAFVDFLGMYRIYYNPNTESIYDRYVAKPNNFFQGVIEIGVAFLPMGSALYEEYLRNNGMVYSSTMGYTVNDAIVDTGMYVVSSIANRLGKSVVEKGLNAYGYLVNIKNALDVITTDEVDSVVFNMFEISGIYANSSNLQYLAGVMQKSYDYVANDFTYFFCQDIIPGKTLFSIACEIMKETDAAKAEKLVQKYVTKYKCNVRTALGRDATDREVWKFEEQISNRDKFNYMLNDFRQKVLS